MYRVVAQLVERLSEEQEVAGAVPAGSAELLKDKMKRVHHKKELNEVQELKLENKELKKQNSQLKKENKKLRREEHHHNEYKYTDIEDDSPVKDPIKYCKECNKGKLIEMSVVGRNWEYCEFCHYDSRHK